MNNTIAQSLKNAAHYRSISEYFSRLIPNSKNPRFQLPVGLKIQLMRIEAISNQIPFFSVHSQSKAHEQQIGLSSYTRQSDNNDCNIRSGNQAATFHDGYTQISPLDCQAVVSLGPRRSRAWMPVFHRYTRCILESFVTQAPHSWLGNVFDFGVRILRPGVKPVTDLVLVLEHFSWK